VSVVDCEKKVKKKKKKKLAFSLVMAKAKAKVILVKLLSSAQTGYFYTASKNVKNIAKKVRNLNFMVDAILYFT
jgi:ribosomal protein L33